MIDFADWVKMANLLYGAGVPGETRPGPVVSLLTGVGLMRSASCQADTSGGYFQRADTHKLKVTFEQNTSTTNSPPHNILYIVQYKQTAYC